MWRVLAIFTFTVMLSETAVRGAATIPYPEALDAAAVRQEQMSDIMENSLILGNGDINGLLWEQDGALTLRLTKNDVWDARVDTSEDPPLLKIDVKNKKLDGPLKGPIPSWHSHPYPCPRACAQVIFGRDGGGPIEAASWRQIRSGGASDRWEWKNGAAEMSVGRKVGASNSFALGPLDLATAEYNTLKIKISGSANAQYFIDVMGSGGRETILSSKWIKSPAEPVERSFALAPGKRIGAIILYTWTLDGKQATNRFHELALEGPGGKRRAIDLEQSMKARPRRSVLDVHRAAARVEPGPEGQAGLEARALAQRNVFLVRTAAAARLEPVLADTLPKPETGEAEGIKFVRQALPPDPDWPGMTFAVALAERGEWKAVAIVTSLEEKDPLAAATRLAKTTLEEKAENLIETHEKTWNEFWGASGVDLDDAELRAAWYRNLYFLRCVSKPGVEAVGLYAGLTNNNPPWHGSHTLNYNSEQTFWSAYVSNHVELGEPYERMFRRYLPRAQWFCRQTYGIEGAHYPHNVFCHEIPDPETCKSKLGRMHAVPPYAQTIGNSGFIAQNLWWHYKYQPDREYLEKTAYPVLREVAKFYAGFIEQCEEQPDGKVLLAPSYSPEHWSLTPDFKYNRNGTFDIAFARFTFQAVREAAKILGRDEDLARRIAAAERKLPDYPLSQDPEPILVDMLEAPPINYNIAVPVAPVFPAGVVTVFSDPGQLALLRRTVERVKWNGYNSSMIMSVARARLSLPDTWSWMKEEFLTRGRPNGTITLRTGDRCGHFTEQFAATMAVSEMLLQSVGDVLRIFPAWPAEKPAKFVNLRAQGGFLVGAECGGGALKQVKVTSTIGGKLRLVSPWKAGARAALDGKTLTLNSGPQGIVELDTRPGQVIIFTQTH